jgi:hypothetical protein
MPRKKYALEPGGPERLELSWGAGWKNLTVSIDGKSVGAVADPKELKAGREFSLEDGSTLRFQTAQSFLTPELWILRSGQPVPGSTSDPAERLRSAAGMVFFVAGLNLLLGLLVVLFHVDFLARLGLGWYSLFFGGLFLVLAFFVQRRSYAAMLTAVILFALDGILGVIGSAMEGGRTPVGGIVARFFLLMPMIKGLGAIRCMNQGPPPADALAGIQS